MHDNSWDEVELRRLAMESQRYPIDARAELQDAVAQLVAQTYVDHAHLPTEIIEHVAYRAAASAVRRRAANRTRTFFHGADRTLYELAAEANVVLADETIATERQRMRDRLSSILEPKPSAAEIERVIESLIGTPVMPPTQNIDGDDPPRL